MSTYPQPVPLQPTYPSLQAPVPANKVFAGPASGNPGPGGFRALVASDMPNPLGDFSNSIPSLQTPILRQFFVGPAASGWNSLGSPPAGKRWIVGSPAVFNVSGGTLTYNVGWLDPGGTTFYLSTAVSVTNTSRDSSPGQVAGFPILESTDQLGIQTSGANLSLWLNVLEFPSSVRVYSNRLYPSAGNNTVYTCPAGYCATVVEYNLSATANAVVGVLAPSIAATKYVNKSGATRTYYWCVVQSGGSPVAPTIAGNNSTAGFPSSLISGYSAPLAGSGFFFLGPGDSLVLNTDGSNPGLVSQIAYATVAEIPIPS